MDNGEKKISSLFDGRTIFNIPEYQRAYAWERPQLEDFVEDIDNQKANKSYFLGTVLFEEKGLEKNYEVINIVDGQQRITTIIIFMAVLIELLKKGAQNTDEEEDIELLYETYIRHKRQFKLRALEEDNDFFHTYVLGEKNGKDYIRTPAQRRMLEAKNYFIDALSSRSKNSLSELKKKVDENSRVLVYSVSDTAEATLIFETTNDRGKSLTNLEKIKSFMMYKSYVASNDAPEQMLKAIRTRFSDIYKEYDKYQRPIAEDSVLQYHFISHETWSGKEYRQYVTKVKERINTLISDQQDSVALNNIDNYTKELRETFFAVHEIIRSCATGVRNIFILSRTENFWPLLIKTFKFDQTKNKAQFSRIATLLETYSFRVYVVNQNRGNTGQSKLYGYARDFKGDFEQLEQNILTLLEGYSSDKLFKANLADQYIYDWMSSRELAYLFWNYENHLRTSEQPKAAPMSEEELLSQNSKLKLSIEHIASQTPKKSIVKDEAVIPTLSADFEDNYLHSIGNLTIDPLSANSSKKNIDFEEKNERYFRKAPFKTQNELEEFVEGERWLGSSIERRKKKILDFAIERWKGNALP